MTAAPQELVENQHEDQFHVDELTGVKTPIRKFLAHEVERIKGVVEHVNDDVARAEAAVKAEAEKVQSALEAENAKLKAELEKLKAKTAAKTAAVKEPGVAPVIEEAVAPAATAVRETGEVK